MNVLAVFALLACSTDVPDGVPDVPDVPDVPEAAAPEGAERTHQAHDATAAWDHYGEPFTLASAADGAELIANPEERVDETVRITGRIENVCQKAGCWMVLADDEGRYLRVTMKGHGFGVPTSTSTGPDTLVDVEGTLIQRELDAETLAHLKSEAKGSEDEKAAQFAPRYEIVATGVAVRKQG